jgi:stress-induced morphogen
MRYNPFIGSGTCSSSPRIVSVGKQPVLIEDSMPEVAFNYNELAPRVEAALREEFVGDGVFLSEGYKGRVHIKIVSTKFDRMSTAERQVYVYEVLNSKLASDSEAVSLVSSYSVEEL